MGDTAAALQSSPERRNYPKLCQLIIDGGTLALKELFDSIHNPASLQTALNNNITTLQQLQRRRILKADQWALLFPAGAAPDSSTFDITLLFMLLREICGLHPPATGWDNKPPPSDTSRAADLARIKWFRNMLAHKPGTTFDQSTFSAHWTELSDALVRLGLDQPEIQRLRGSRVVDEDQYIKMLEDWKREEDSIKEQLETVIQNQAEMQKDLQHLKAPASPVQHEGSDKKTIGDIMYFHNDVYLLGKGCKGTKVYKGTLRSTGKKIAVKRIFAELFDLKEANHLRQLKHPNIIECFAVEKKEDFIYLALDLGEKTLKMCIEDNDFGRQESGVTRIECLMDSTRAVEYLHDRNICHRDIKPDNILLFDSAPPRFVLADFNTAKESGSNESSATQQGHSIVGSLGYMAPEVYRSGKRSRKQDMFSLGCVFFYTLTNKGHPFGSVEHLRKCQNDIDRGRKPSFGANFLDGAWMRPVIELMVSHDPEERPKATDVLDKLKNKDGADIAEHASKGGASSVIQDFPLNFGFPVQETSPVSLEPVFARTVYGVGDERSERSPVPQSSFSTFSVRKKTT